MKGNRFVGEPAPGKRGFRRMRAIACAAVFVSVCVGLVFHTGAGTLSSFGVGSIASVCPLGQLEVFLAGGNANVHMVVVFAVMVALIVLFGRAFCAWLCPVPPITRFFRKKKPPEQSSMMAGGAVSEITADDSPNGFAVDETAGGQAEALDELGALPLAPIGGARDGFRVDSRHIVLGGALLSAGIFGLPVFCLVCPVGLAFATVITVFCMFRFGEVSVGVLLFPAIIALEVLVCRKWCTAFCPLGALMSLIAQFNKTFRPQVDGASCLRSGGADCRRCVRACPEKVDPHSRSVAECTKCGECVAACPASAIRLRFVPASRRERAAENKEGE